MSEQNKSVLERKKENMKQLADAYTTALENGNISQVTVLNGKVVKGYTFFYTLHSPFSNFHPAKFVFDGLTFFSSEHYMMYSKAKLFNDQQVLVKLKLKLKEPIAVKFLNGELNSRDIINTKELYDEWKSLQMSVKGLGREVKDYNEQVWSERRFEIVKRGVKQKFKQNKHLFDELMKTQNTLLVEAAREDRVWGIGLDTKTAKNTPESEWNGLNLLGKLLTEIREEFKQE